MGLDIYLRWDGITEDERKAQYTGYMPRPAAGYLRFNWAGVEWATTMAQRYGTPQAWPCHEAWGGCNDDIFLLDAPESALTPEEWRAYAKGEGWNAHSIDDVARQLEAGRQRVIENGFYASDPENEWRYLLVTPYAVEDLRRYLEEVRAALRRSKLPAEWRAELKAAATFCELALAQVDAGKHNVRILFA